MHLCRRRARRTLFELRLERFQAVFDQSIDRALREPVVGTPFVAGRNPREDLDPLLDGVDRPDVELAGCDRLGDIVPQDDIGDIRAGDHHALVTRQAAHAADIEEAFDLRGSAADGLDIAQLIN